MLDLPGRSVRGRVDLAWMLPLLLLWGCGEQGSPAPVACGAGEVAAPDGTCRPPDKSCPLGELLLESGECQPVGPQPDMPCPPGEWPSADGTCQAAGVPPESCAEGFAPDGNGGCNAILPAEECPPGQMAVPGETSCREVAPCGNGPWGTIPVEANTQFVDQAYAGGDSDGTMAKPWTTVQQGVDAAAGGAIVAVTDGVYAEDVRIEGKAVRLWGRCPVRVEIQGTGGELGAVEIFEAGANGAVIRGLAVTGATVGVLVMGASDVRIEQVWAHDAGGRGIDIKNTYGPTSVSMQGSLVEQNHELGVFVGASNVELSATVVRATQPVGEENGRGISIQDNPVTHERAKVGIRGCVVEQNHDAGVFIAGSDAELAATVVRDTQALTGQAGSGIGVQADPSTGERAKVDIRGCVVERSHGVGVNVFGSDAKLEATVVRDPQPVNGQGGRGIGIHAHRDTGERATVDIRGCMVEENHELGVFVYGSDVELVATVVRDTQPVNGQRGTGIVIGDHPETGERAKVGIRGCVVEQSHEVGVLIGGSDAELEATVVRDTQPANGQEGRGISIQSDPDTGERATAVIRGCVVEQNHAIGIGVILSDAAIDATTVRDTAAGADSSFGDGIAVENGTATIQRTTVSGSARAGISSFGASVTVLSSLITCNAFDVHGETDDGIPASFDGSADWQCSRAGAEDCTETDSCHVVSASLVPPAPIEPIEPSSQP